jgi:DNA-binding NtrC family response regulator
VTAAKPSILLIESERAYRDETATGLQDAGYRVIACSKTSEALEVVNGPEQIDYLITRVLMPPNQAHGVALALMVRHHKRSERRRIRILIHAQRYDELPPAVLESAPGTIHRRPKSGAELCRLFMHEFGPA